MIKIYEMTSKQVDKADSDFCRKMIDKYGEAFLLKTNDSENRKYEEISCRGMMVSVLAYNCSPSMSIDEVVDILMNNRYVKEYITGKDKICSLGYDTVLELAKDMAKDYCGKAKVAFAGYDSEGVWYNSLTYPDED